MAIENKYLRQAAGIAITQGESGYFSTPRNDLDPNIFQGQKIRPEVRTHVLNTLYGFLSQHFHRPQAWSKVWIAGSGVSYQWAAGRGNGDLDCLFGVDWIAFRKHNPNYAGLGNSEAATLINTLLRDHLWPRTAHTRFGKQFYELTFYVNVNTGLDIRSIRPYAAYDLTTDTWSVRPPKLPSDPASLFPPAWKSAIATEARQAAQIVKRFHKAAVDAEQAQPNSGAWTNARAVMNLAEAQAAALFEDIHTGRRAAFSDQGAGYSDWANFRWQSHKKNGVVNALRAISQLRDRPSMSIEDIHNELLKSQLASIPGVRL
ncbi:hypothetical protein [Nonomuraea sp. SYSU D8015]|uniref:hypothetical protein n=1 Tax=Nonomuraea sp. SYSU D8015 TaxID=2593644 RepID=UPI0016604AAC|nr:hypothetical protein [Nonomuraea sp. SYSU D8015]